MEIKNLHPMIAAQIKTILKRTDIRIEEQARFGSNTFKVFDPKGQELISYDNSYDYGMYTISALGQTVAAIKWRENDGVTTPEQKAVFEIGDLIDKRMQELKKAQQMSDEDKQILSLLQQHTNEIKTK